MRNTLCQLINPKNKFLKLTHLENDHPEKEFFRQQQREMPRRAPASRRRPGSAPARRSVLFRNVVWIKSQGGTLVARIDPARAARTSDWVARTWLRHVPYTSEILHLVITLIWDQRAACLRGSSTKIPDFDFFKNKFGLFFWSKFSTFLVLNLNYFLVKFFDFFSIKFFMMITWTPPLPPLPPNLKITHLSKRTRFFLSLKPYGLTSPKFATP